MSSERVSSSSSFTIPPLPEPPVIQSPSPLLSAPNKYTFLPWIKTGIGTRIQNDEKDLRDSKKLRAEIPINLSVNRYDNKNNAIADKVPTVELALYGPGDVIGILNKVVIRTDPKANDVTFEPNYFPYIEFSQPEFPWRFTPAKPNAHSPSMAKLSPWLCLIVLKREEFEGPIFEGLLPQIKITVDPKKALPDLEQSWAYAHCQIAGEVKENNNGEQEIKEILISQSHRAISRILCLRDLEANTTYHAFLVPTFEVGRLAGIGEKIDVGAGNNISGTDFAWKIEGSDKSPAGHVLPVYYQWQFGTGEGGDFESLVTKLKARALPKDFGLRDLDVSNPFPLTTGITRPLALGGILWSSTANDLPETKQKQIDVHTNSFKDTPNPPDSSIKKFIKELKSLLDLPEKSTWSFIHQSTVTDPIISPPIYGKWHTRKRLISKIIVDISVDNQDPDWVKDPDWIKDLVKDTTLTTEERTVLVQQLDNLRNDPPYPWLEELNLDPTNRTAAGLGTIVVQDLQEELMASAWDQVGAVIEANKRLRSAQLARTLSKNIFDRTLKIMNASVMIGVVSPLHGKVIIQKKESMSVSNLFAASPIPAGFFSPSFKKITLRRGKIHRKLFDSSTYIYSNLLEHFNKNPSNPDPNPPNVRTIVTRDSGGEEIYWYSYPVTIDPLWGDTETKFRDALDRASEIEELRAKEVERTIPPPNATIEQPTRSIAELDSEADSDSVFKKSMRGALLSALDPDRTINLKLSVEVNRPQRLNEDKKDKLDPILGYPKFNRPMYSALRDLDQDLLLPGVGSIPENTIGVLETNTAFVNSYMVGLNHEMARELLWRGYPTDQRGTYFRQFWDPSMAVQRERLEKQKQSPQGIITPLDPEEEDKIVEKYRDIKEIHLWKKDSPLSESQNDSSGERTVLIIKGDVLRRYPGTVIYASKAVWHNNKHTLPTVTEEENPVTHKQKRVFPDLKEESIEPVFRGTMYPDITFFGFAKSSDELKGEPDDSFPAHEEGKDDNAGWYFIIQEQPSEPRFGLDERRDPPASLTKWDDLSWNHVSPLSASNYIELQNGPLIGMEFNNVKWGSHSADTANITLQNRVRVAIHASEMISPP